MIFDIHVLATAVPLQLCYVINSGDM